VFATLSQLKQLDPVKNIDPERLVLYITNERSESKDAIIEAVGDTTVDLYFHEVKDVTRIQDFLRLYGDERPAVYVSLDETVFPSPKDAYISLIKSSAIPVIPASTLSVEKESTPETIPVSSLLNIDSDRPDGLIATVVTNESGVALGLVYSSPESIQESLRTGRGVYQSRKRGLWYKGESSGDIQELIGVSLDCDHDCVKFIVRQKGRGMARVYSTFEGETVLTCNKGSVT
jgi:phosphoribosyl-ATP pyrophosphohydrolase/phosphoribosyl-AMP cyclohydrolase/histidinol dehydrogenase